MGTEAVDYLKSREICDSNMGSAFGGVTLSDSATTLTGKNTYRKLRGKGFLVNGVTQYKDIYTVDQNFEGGKIWVKDIEYKLENLQTVTIPNAPWNKSGDMKITVTFQRCGNGGPVYRMNNGVKSLACTNIIEQKQVINKMAALKTTSGVVGQFACADSQDALVDAANEYTNQKVCMLEATLLAKSGSAGTTSCNWTVEIIPEEKNSGSISITGPIVSNSIYLKMVGGGGGGGGGDRDQPGGGGAAGQYHEQAISDAYADATCSLNQGSRGSGGDGDSSATRGGTGGTTTVSCSKSGQSNISLSRAGGGGGCAECRGSGEETGWNGADSGANGIVFGAGGSGGGREKNGNAGGCGAGGGGGGDRWGEGGQGGLGCIKLTWKRYVIKDQNGNIVVASSSGGTTGSGGGGSTTTGGGGGGGGGGGYTTGGGGGGGGGCFVAGTLVAMADGSYKNIEDILLGEKLRDGSGKIVSVKQLRRYATNGAKYSINGGGYFFTANHPFLTAEGWKSLDPVKTMLESPGLGVRKLKVGDLLIREDGIELIISLDSIQTEETVYNFTLDGSHEYIANGYVVHNKQQMDDMQQMQQ